MNSSAQTFRRATLDDSALLGELNHQLIRDEGHRNSSTAPQLAERMRHWLSTEYQAVIAERNGEVLAYALFRPLADEIYLRQLFVVRDRRRKGIGRALIEHLRSCIWPRNVRLTVEVLAANSRAVQFWRAMGYKDYALTLEIMPANSSR